MTTTPLVKSLVGAGLLYIICDIFEKLYLFLSELAVYLKGNWWPIEPVKHLHLRFSMQNNTVASLNAGYRGLCPPGCLCPITEFHKTQTLQKSNNCITFDTHPAHHIHWTTTSICMVRLVYALRVSYMHQMTQSVEQFLFLNRDDEKVRGKLFDANLWFVSFICNSSIQGLFC